MKPILLPLLLVAMPLFAQESTTPAPPAEPIATQGTAEPATEKAKEKMRCKRMAAIGSRLGKRVCHTEEEWTAIEQGAKEFSRNMGNAPQAMNEGNIYNGAAGGGNCDPKCP